MSGVQVRHTQGARVKVQLPAAAQSQHRYSTVTAQSPHSHRTATAQPQHNHSTRPRCHIPGTTGQPEWSTRCDDCPDSSNDDASYDDGGENGNGGGGVDRNEGDTDTGSSYSRTGHPISMSDIALSGQSAAGLCRCSRAGWLWRCGRAGWLCRAAGLGWGQRSDSLSSKLTKPMAEEVDLGGGSWRRGWCGVGDVWEGGRQARWAIW